MNQGIVEWSVDYGYGPNRCDVPHAWGREQHLMWEGPAVYRTVVHIPEEQAWLKFEGVSYLAVVMINDEVVCTHEGIWDAFSVDLAAWAGQTIELKVRVIKNGGSTYPVPDVASGFLPYVYGTFGGIYRPVKLVVSDTDPVLPKPKVESRVGVDGCYISLDEKPWELRGLLSWGWQPGFVSPDRTGNELDEWIDKIQELGFNTIKFCLWVPTHETLRRMHAKGMEAWIELPIWMPNPDKLLGMTDELKRIVSQYRHHPNIVAWTIGCELGKLAPAEWREEMVEFVLEETNCPLVMDSSGGSEMYGGDPREYGTFYDFHPYCDTHFYPQVIDSLLTGPRKKKPIIFGEFCDHDSLRDLARIEKENPFWASDDEYLNAQGVRWQYDLPKKAWDESFFWSKIEVVNAAAGIFHRWRTLDHVRSQPEIAGFVITGEIDTPISSSGMFDDWGESREDPSGAFQRDFFTLVPKRRPPWINGGNRAGWSSPWWAEEGEQVELQPVVKSPKPIDEFILILERRLSGKGKTESEEIVLQEADRTGLITVCQPVVIQHHPDENVMVQLRQKGSGNAVGAFRPIFSWPKETVWPGVKFEDPTGHLMKDNCEGAWVVSTNGLRSEKRGVHICFDSGTLPRPYVRECIRRNGGSDPDAMIAPDRALDPSALDEAFGKGNWTSLIDRIDTRTFEVLPYAVRVKDRIYTTLRLGGGHGNQPIGLDNNLLGQQVLKDFLTQLGWSPDTSSEDS
jgi:hypothetical protein